MKLMLSLILLSFSFLSQATVKFDVAWTEKFTKELVITCSPKDSTCLSLCQKNDTCRIKEDFCRDCIGTGLKMSRLISEIGSTIKYDGKFADRNRVYDFVMEKNFVALVPNDVYNVIDGTGAVRALQKFENLCPKGSDHQVLLVSVDQKTRKIIKPEYVACEFYGFSWFYGISETPEIDIDDASVNLPLH